MQKLFTIILLTIFLGACATMPNSTSSLDLTTTIDQLKTLNAGAIETKRAAAIAVLEHWLFDAGYWQVILDNSTVRPGARVDLALEEITRLAIKREELQKEGKELTDYELGQSLAWYTFMVVGIAKHASQEILPQMAQLLALF